MRGKTNLKRCGRLTSVVCLSLLGIVGCSKEEAPQKSGELVQIGQTRELTAETTTASVQAANTRKITSMDDAREGTVLLQTGWGLGSGFFVDDRCLIVTNKHVVSYSDEDYAQLESEQAALKAEIAKLQEGIRQKNEQYYNYEGSEHHKATRQRINELRAALAEDDALHSVLEDYRRSPQVEVKTFDGTIYRSLRIVDSDEQDLAFVSIAKDDCKYFENAGNNLPKVGEKVYTVGAPVGLEFSVTSGILSGIREFEGHSLLQTDAAINPGNSGGPLLNEKARLLGVNTLKLEGVSGIGFAIPMSMVESNIQLHRLGATPDSRASGNTTLAANTTQLDFDKYRNQAESKAPEPDTDTEKAKQDCYEQVKQEQYSKALILCRLAAQSGDGLSNYHVGKILLEGLSGNQDEFRAAEFLKVAATAGEAEAQYLLGDMYLLGHGVQVDAEQAIGWLTKAGEQGESEAYNRLGVMYNAGKLVYRNPKKALEYFGKAQEKGNLNAMHNIAAMYLAGSGVTQDEEKAFQLFRQAAEKGSPTSQLMVAYCYYKKLGTQKDYVESYAWLALAEVNKRGEELDGWDSDRAFEMRQFLSRIMSNDQVQKAQVLSRDYITRYGYKQAEL